jgi:predicted O-methyltransferase YrrM
MTFQEIRSKINIYTAVDDNRLKLLHEKVKETSHLIGPMAEIGVYKGGSAYMIAATDPNRILYLCDSFEGLPETVDQDKVEGEFAHSKGDFADTSAVEVHKFLKDLPNKQLFEGFFPDTEIHRKLYTKTFSFVHIDVDLYHPTLDCLEFFWPRMDIGGIIVSDDYGWKHTPGVKKAFDEFFKNKVDKVIDSGYNSCWIRKN